MRKKIQLYSSGISFVDETWGGFYNCGSYILVGPHKSGKTLLGLQFAQEAVKQQGICIYFTSMRPKDLMINAASINFDLQSSMDQNQVILIKINPPKEKEIKEDQDHYLTGYLQDIVSIVEQYQPAKLVFDELTPFVNYEDESRLKEIFLQTCDVIENAGITSLFILSEPVSQQSKKIVDILKENSTGLIHLKKNVNSEGLFESGNITITPNVGHTEGQFKTNYFIKSGKGIVTETIKSSKGNDKTTIQARKKENQYKSLSEIETSGSSYLVNNVYNEKEFRLLLNNQIAYYKSTGKIFTICSILFDKDNLEAGLLTLNQLKNAVRLSIDRKDKISLIDNRIIVLIVDEDQKSVNSLIARIKSNLPVDSNEQMIKVIQNISVYTTQVDKNITDADDILNKIFLDKYQDKHL